TTRTVASSVDVWVKAILGASTDQALLTISPQPSCQVARDSNEFYDLEVLARTGQNLSAGSRVITVNSTTGGGGVIDYGLGDGPSINKDGKVTFIARSPNPGTWSSNVIFTVDAAGVCKAINPQSSSGILAFGDAVQINDGGRIATS